ncbi:site-specific DNA-methyltransferase [Bacillus spizizenii]|nr:site-specific DNA-methyltransferase [Bacillus spizizenii]MCY9127419.1 site-specific DNA-methyltransferase [Bacillus spizizenii]MCY9132820.1 site-specific DNA-methyltransferase [Bacillus spizizenii]
MGKQLLGSLELNRIYQMDCLEGLKMLPDNSVNLAIIDPPYSGLVNKSKQGSGGRMSNGHIAFDDMSERAFQMFFTQRLYEIYRVLEMGSHIYVYTDWKQLRNMMDCVELSSFKLLNLITWDKQNMGLGSGYRQQSEYVIVASKGLHNSFNLKNVSNVLKQKRVHRGEHQHQKPIELSDIYIENSTKENDIILVPFVGSGSECVSAVNKGRNFIGFELESKYIELANKRLEVIQVDDDLLQQINTGEF